MLSFAVGLVYAMPAISWSATSGPAWSLQRTTSCSPSASRAMAVGDVAGQQGPADARLDLALDEAPQRACAVDGVVALAGDEHPRRLAELEGDAPVGQPGADVGDLQVDDPLDLGQRERLEQHDVVDAVEELRAEVRAGRP
jgi:hypothetical protein